MCVDPQSENLSIWQSLEPRPEHIFAAFPRSKPITDSARHQHHEFQVAFLGSEKSIKWQHRVSLTHKQKIKRKNKKKKI